MSPSDALNQDAPNRPLQPHAGMAGQRPATMPATAVVLSPARPLPAPPPALLAAPPAVLPTPSRVLRAVRRRLVLALYLGLAAGWLAAVCTWLVPGLSGAGAYSLVHVDAGGDASPDFEARRQTEAALVKQHAVLEAALADPAVAAACPGRDSADRVRWLKGHLTADFAPGPEVLRIGLPGDRPEAAAEVVTAVTRAYLDASARHERQQRAARLEAMTATAGRCEEQLHAQREALLRRTGGADDGNGAGLRQRLLAERLAQAEHDLFQVRTQISALQTEVNARRQGAGDSVPVAEPAVEERLDTLLQKDALYQKEVNRQAALEGEIDQIAKVAAHPEVQTLPARRELEASRAATEGRRRQLRKVAVKAEQDRARQGYRAATARREERLAVLREQEKQLAGRVKELGEEARPKPPGDDEVGRLEADVLRTEQLVKRTNEQVQALRVEQDAPPRATALEGPVVVPADRRRQAEWAGLAGLGGFAVALFGVGWWQLRGGRVDAPGEVTQWLGLRLLGVVPAVPPRVCRRLGEPGEGRDGAWHGRLNEALDVARTLLLRDPQADALQVILVTSAVGGEGKTSLASQLAASLARGGHKTLLVDADLRRPSAHRLFDLPGEPGLGELLRGEAAVADVVQPTRVSRLWLVAAGAADGHTPQALAQEGVEQVFEELRGQFDYVVLDACPVLPVADALLLARHADGVILSVLRDASRLPRLHAACQRLAMVGARVLGAVVSGARGDACTAEYHDRTHGTR